MNIKQQKEYSGLKTTAEKAKYLLQFEIVAKLNIDSKELKPVNQAFIGKVALPITGDSDEEVVRKARVWLEELAAA